MPELRLLYSSVSPEQRGRTTIARFGAASRRSHHQYGRLGEASPYTTRMFEMRLHTRSGGVGGDLVNFARREGEECSWEIRPAVGLAAWRAGHSGTIRESQGEVPRKGFLGYSRKPERMREKEREPRASGRSREANEPAETRRTS